ncbi:RagB/SusD family nutrient uptake outer membrane protein [Sphingobacterium kyonggiense]
MRRYLKKTLFFLLMSTLVYSCSDFLEEKPDVNLATPQNIEDLRALLDNESEINRNFPGLLEMGTDDFYLDYADWLSRPSFEKAIYCWEKDPVMTSRNTSQYWTNSYGVVSTANVVLESLERLGLHGTKEGREIQGEAYFIRGYMHYALAQIYGQSTDTDGVGLGIPVVTSSDIEQKTHRKSVTDTYNMIIDDLKKASDLLPEKTAYLTRTDKKSAFAALARVYLYRGEYENALECSDEVLKRHSELLDYNNVTIASKNPFPVKENPEVLYFAVSASASQLLAVSRSNVDSLLYSSYQESDLRKTAFFNRKRDKVYTFKGFYSGSEVSYFNGLALDEIYLIRAECLIRQGEIEKGLTVLNYLLERRYRRGSFVPYSGLLQKDALDLVFSERRKELIRRGVRWSDLRRMNRQQGHEKTLKRVLKKSDGVEDTFILPPNDPRYVYQIPAEVISMTGILQNPR